MIATPTPSVNYNVLRFLPGDIVRVDAAHHPCWSPGLGLVIQTGAGYPRGTCGAFRAWDVLILWSILPTNGRFYGLATAQLEMVNAAYLEPVWRVGRELLG